MRLDDRAMDASRPSDAGRRRTSSSTRASSGSEQTPSAYQQPAVAAIGASVRANCDIDHSPCSGTCPTRRVRQPASPPSRRVELTSRDPATNPPGQLKRIRHGRSAGPRPQSMNDSQDEFRAAQRERASPVQRDGRTWVRPDPPRSDARTVLPQLARSPARAPLQVTGYRGEVGRGRAATLSPTSSGAAHSRSTRPGRSTGISAARPKRRAGPQRLRQHLPATDGKNNLRSRITALPGSHKRLPVGGDQADVVPRHIAR